MKSDRCSRILAARGPEGQAGRAQGQPFPSWTLAPQARASVLGLTRIDLVHPLQNAAAQVLHVRETDRLQELLRLRAAAAHLALRDDLAVARQLLIAPRQL